LGWPSRPLLYWPGCPDRDKLTRGLTDWAVSPPSPLRGAQRGGSQRVDGRGGTQRRGLDAQHSSSHQR
jgi:hypothetical protein